MGAETAALAIIAASSGMQAYGAIKAGKDQKRAESFNADIARQRAVVARQKGALDVARQRKQAERFKSRQVALAAKSGVAFTGSPLEVFADTAGELELDAMIIQYNSEVEAKRAEFDATMAGFRGKMAVSEGYARAGNILLQQSASFATQYYGAKTGGVKDGADYTGQKLGSNQGVRDNGTVINF